MDFNIKSKKASLWFIYVDAVSSVRISTDTKTLLERIVGLLGRYLSRNIGKWGVVDIRNYCYDVNSVVCCKGIYKWVTL